MRRTLVLVWKEWREQQWFLYGGLATFLVFPLMEILYKLRKGYTVWTETPEGIVLSLGGLLAIIVGVGATCRDLSPRLQSFWQSRPVGLSRWLAVKYAVGLVIVVLVCFIPIWLQLRLARSVNPFTLSVLACHTFTIVLIYSVAFFLGCLVRRAAQAAILAVAVGLFIYFLPILVPPLGWLGVINLIDKLARASGYAAWDPYGRFVVTMCAGSMLALAAARVAVGRDWRLRVDKKVVAGTLGAVLLLLGCAAAFEVGTNLTCLQLIDIDPPNRPPMTARSVSRIIASGGRGVLVLNNRPPGYIPVDVSLTLCGFDLSGPGPNFGNEIPLTVDYDYLGIGRSPFLDGALVWSEARPNRVYFLWTSEQRAGNVGWREDAILMTIATDAPPDRAVIHRLDLSSYGYGSQIHEYRGRIYFVCSESLDEAPHIVVIDVRQPDEPRVAEVVESPGRFGVFFAGGPYKAGYEVPGVVLPRIEGLSDRERLELALLLVPGSQPPMVFGDEMAITVEEGGLSVFRLTGIEDDSAKFEPVGRYRRTFLEQLVLGGSYGIVLKNGLACVLGQHGLTVYDVRQPEHPRRVGYYASSEDSFGDAALLPDGRILLGGGKLHVLTAPKVD